MIFQGITTATIFALLLTYGVNSFPQYADELPNGQQIPHPCDRSKVWYGVGHENPGGTGKTNPFGEHFDGLWTKELCQYDSDGDGRTNGEEVGDPDCVWKKGAVPAITDPLQLSHPGVCEPVEDPKCLSVNRFLRFVHPCEDAFRKAVNAAKRPEL